MTLEELKKAIESRDKRYVEIKGEEFRNIRLEAIEIAIRFYDCNFYDCIFDSNYSGSIHVKGCKYENCKFKNLKNEDMYIEMHNTIFKSCQFEKIEFESEEQTVMQGNKYENCNFKDVKLCGYGNEMSMVVYNSCIENSFIISAEIISDWEKCKFVNSIIRGYIVDNTFKDVKMIDTKIDGDFENNKCINCTLDGKEFTLEDN